MKRYALIGCGGVIAEDHLEALGSVDVDLVAMVDLDPEKGSTVAKDFGARFFQDHREMLAETAPDVAIVATPHPSHARIAIDAMEAGAHVLVEKPMAVEVAEADAMIEAAQRTNRTIGLCFQFRFQPAIEEAHRLISEGALGRLLRLECRESGTRTAAYFAAAAWRGTWAGEGGGVLLNQAPHILDLACHLAGPPTRVSGWTRRLMHAIECEDTGLALIEFASGAVGELTVSTVDPAPMRIELVGERGRMQILDGSLQVTLWEPDLATHIATSPEHYDPPEPRDVRVRIAAGDGEHVDVHRDFLAAIEQGRRPRASGHDGLASLELANAAVLSAARDGAAVELPLDRTAYAELLADRRAAASSPGADD